MKTQCASLQPCLDIPNMQYVPLTDGESVNSLCQGPYELKKGVRMVFSSLFITTKRGALSYSFTRHAVNPERIGTSDLLQVYSVK